MWLLWSRCAGLVLLVGLGPVPQVLVWLHEKRAVLLSAVCVWLQYSIQVPHVWFLVWLHLFGFTCE